MLDYTITNRSVYWSRPFIFISFFPELISVYCQYYFSLLSVLFSIHSVQLQILYIDCCLEKNQRNFFKAKSSNTSDSKMSPQTSNTIHRTDSVNAKCGFFQEIVKFAPHSTLLLIPQLPAHLLPFHLQ